MRARLAAHELADGLFLLSRHGRRTETQRPDVREGYRAIVVLPGDKKMLLRSPRAAVANGGRSYSRSSQEWSSGEPIGNFAWMSLT